MGYGARISYYRKLNRMTQSDLGKLLSVTPQAVSKWELEKAEPDRKSIVKMCELFGIDANDLLGISTTEQPEDDVWQLREQLRRDPNRRLLFDAAKNVREEDILTAVKILDALKGGADGDDI